MFYEPCARITISSKVGFLEFNSVNKVEIEESVKNLGNKAIIVIPRNYKDFEGVSVLSLLAVGASVKIELGYDDQYYTEFVGFIDEIESEAPITLHVDDTFYSWKHNSIKTNVKNATLKSVLTTCFPGLTIECPNVKIADNYPISNLSSYQVLLKLKDQFGFYSRLSNNKLDCLWPFKLTGGISGTSHTYKFYTHTVKKSQLKYARKEDIKVRVRVTSSDRRGGKVKYETGVKEGEGDLYQMELPAGLPIDELKKYGDAWYNRLSFDGFTGSITGFGTPRTKAGDSLEVIDELNPDKKGRYLIDAVKISYGLDTGFQRENTLSFKV